MARIDLGRLRFYYQGEYSGATEYEINDVVKYGGNVYVYKYVTAATGYVPTNVTYWDLMVPGFKFEGVYANGTGYQPGDVVTYGGLGYICILTTTGNLPTNATYWSTIVDGIQYEGAWSSGTNYQENDVVTYGTNVYIALRDTIADEPDTSASDWSVLTEGLNWIGAWSSTVLYYVNDIITRGGISYVCLLRHTSGTFQTDLSANKWQVLTEGFRWRGEWAGNTTYLVNDLAYYGVTTYISNAEFTSHASVFSNDVNWEIFALGVDIPSQASNSGKYLSTNGSILAWSVVDALPAQANNAGKLLTTDGTNASWSYTVSEIIVLNDAIIEDILYVGDTASSFATNAALTNPMAVFDIAANDYAQVSIHNSGNNANSSTDLIMYTNNGDDTSGWIDVGITSAAFNDAGFTITGAHDGYIFVEAPVNTAGQGNLVLATGANGTENKIIFAAGGLSTDNTQMVITPDVNIHIEIPTPSISPATGALTVVGGVGIQGDVYIEGTIVFGGGGTTVETTNLNVTDPFIFVGSGNQSDTVDLAFIGEYATAISAITNTVSNKALTNNIATLTTSANHTYLVGDVVVVSGVDATFNGTFSIASVPTATTFTYGKTAANVASVAGSGSAVVSARRKFAGVGRDASDGVVKFFSDATTKPTSVVDFSEAGLVFSDIRVGAVNASGSVVMSGGLNSSGTTTLSSNTSIGDVSSTEIGYLNGVASDIQTQIDGKISLSLINAVGDIIVGSADNTVTIVSIGAANTVLTSNGTTLTWAAATGGGASLSSIFMLMGA